MPYCAEPKEKDSEEEEVEDMLVERVSGSDLTECPAPRTFSLKEDGLSSFCVNYINLNKVTGRDSDQIRKLKKCIDPLRNAAVFSTF